MTATQTYPDRGCETSGRNLAPLHSFGAPPRSGEIVVQRTLLGLQLPYLPDFLADHTLVGQNDSERLAELLERQVQFVANLWKWQSAAFSLRFIYRPEQAGIQVALLARILSRPESAAMAAEQLGADLMRLAQTFGLTVRQVATPADLAGLRMPVPNPSIVEVRQREEVVSFPWAQGDAYVVYPYWQPAGAFLQPCEALLRLSAPCVVNLHLEPTSLGENEYRALVNAAATAQTAADWQRSAHSIEYSGRWADPQAAAVARVYAAQLRRLAQPFVMAAQVASSDRFAAMSIAQSLGAAFTARPMGRADDELISSFDIVYAGTDADAQAAARTLNHLILTPWGRSQAEESPDLIRLRYLADARGAAALFRFPIAVRGGVPGVEVRQPMPDFEPGGRRANARPDELNLGSFQRGGAVTLRLKDLSRHGLIAGLPGSGKTNTCLYLLSQLHERGVPFLVIEPAKTEYRGLVRQPGFEDLLVFTLGDETTAPFRLNPFELLPGVRLEVHLEALNVAINAAMPQFGVLPSIIEEALEAAYTSHSWRLSDRGGEGEPKLFPTMADFCRQAVQAIEGRGYRGELHDNIQAAVKGRIGSLLRGSKGRMFNCRRSLPFELLFDRPAVLELDSLSDDVKALTMMFLLILLREHRQGQARRAGELSAGFRHLLLIEEAHRILENVAAVGNTEVAADTRAKSVRAMTDFLVEMRAYGQGVLIAEQSPEKLAPDAVRNTNLKIGHMLPGRQDREALAAAMIMDQAQEQFMGKLRVGQAAVFMTGLEKATFMTVPDYKGGVGFADFLPDAAVKGHMARFYEANRLALLPFDGCRFCGEPCEHRDAIEPITRRKETAQRFQTALTAFDERPEPAHWPANWQEVAAVCGDAAAQAGRPDHQEAAYCYLAHEIDFPFTEHMRRAFVRAVEALPASG
ncbi:MAG: ATP-binding protein [Chloroflexi bacterium]|nr:ATP-binding protein [Chloroflexota bacterium]